MRKIEGRGEKKTKKKMGCRRSKPVIPVVARKTIKESLQLISQKSGPILFLFNDSFFQKLHLYTCGKIAIEQFDHQLNIFKTILQVLLEKSLDTQKQLLWKLRSILQEENINESSHNALQQSLIDTMKLVLGDQCTESIMSAWSSSCREICRAMKSI